MASNRSRSKPTAAESPGATKGLLISRRACLAATSSMVLGALTTGATAQGAVKSQSGSGVTAGEGIGVVTTAAGSVRGYVRHGIFTFKGIPYGESTAGANRFMPPVPRKPWSGVRSCLSYGPVSPQPRDVTLAGDEANFLLPKDRGIQDEDCLRLNIWTPAIGTDAKLPVMVFLHGGRYTTGSSHELRAYDGENLAQQGELVVVSINHRLGALGFLDLSHLDERLAVSGNVGMLDIVAALEWLHTNIRNFGGDPARVTVFGQSGGAGKVAALLAMPRAQGLFHRAIAQSGPLFKAREPAAARSMADVTLHALGQDRFDLLHVQGIPFEQLVTAGEQVNAGKRGPVFSPDLSHGDDTVGWAPLMDGKVLIAHPFSPAIPAISAAVPLMIGTTLNELGSNIDRPEGEQLTEGQLQHLVEEMSGDHAVRVIETFRRRTPDATPANLWSRIASAPVRSAAVEQCRRKAAAGRGRVWLYWFTWQTPVLDGRPHACHCSELPFVFNNSERCDSFTGGGQRAAALARRMSGSWSAFARSGDPNHAGLGLWPAYDPQRGATMIFDDRCLAEDSPDRQELAALAGA